jgi:formylglycine-generating enzyme required for sulfatase activity
MQEPAPVSQQTDTYAQWLYACSAGGTNAYPYGTTYEPGTCQGGSTPGASISPVASSPQCVGGYPGIYDMSGNVWEWVDACGNDTDYQAFCSSFGGGYASPDADLTCLSERWWTRVDGAADLGFRCCADL